MRKKSNHTTLMKILYVHQYFNTPEEGGCIRSYNLAKGLVEAGHQVTMITGHNQKSGLEKIGGINVQYLKIPYKNQFGFVRRIWAFYQFVRQAKRLINQLDQKFDLAYVMTTPLTTGFIALYIKAHLNIPYYFEVGDLWPEAPIKMGAVKNEFIKKWLYQFEKKCYFEAQKVIALSPAIRNYIEATSPETKVHVVTNFSDVDFFEHSRRLQRFGSENPLKIGYFGTFGPANELTNLLEVAKACLKHEVPVHFTLMGDGKEYSSIKAMSKNLPNVSLKPFGSADSVKETLEAQDGVYVSFKNLEILNTGSPNKFFDGLAAGKLIIINFGGWIRTLVDKHKCGFHHYPNEPMDFVRKAQAFIKEPSLLDTYQKNSRQLAEAYYSKDLQLKKLLKILENEKHLNISDSEVYILTA